MSRWVSDFFAVILALVVLYGVATIFIVAARAVMRLAGKLRSGPGPDSRLERLLADHERDEAYLRASESRDDEGAA